MMFLEYFALGAWIVPLARYLAAAPADGGLGYSPADVGWIYASLPIAGMLSPLLVGPLADRFVPAEKLLGGLHLASAGLMAAAGWAAGQGATPGELFPLLLGYSILFMPTLPLTNVIALRNLAKPAETFGRVRLVGTFGWIVSGFAVAWLVNPVSPGPLYLTAGTAAVLGAASFALLPHTPPKGHGRSVGDIIGLPALRMFRDRAFVAYAASAVVVHVMNQFYTLFAARYLAESGVSRPEQWLTLAQWCEMACMAAVPWLVRGLGLGPVMFIGLVGWGVRNALLAYAPVPVAVWIGVPLHGLGYAWFTIVAALFVDREAPPHLRAAAQALVTFLGSGPAVLVGMYLAGAVAGFYQSAAGTDWTAVWLVPTLGYVAAVVIFVGLFREPVKAHP
jgi:nucleoside transporter